MMVLNGDDPDQLHDVADQIEDELVNVEGVLGRK